MSAINGDKARFGRQRKEKIQRRIRMRQMRKTLQETAPSARARAQREEFVASLDLESGDHPGGAGAGDQKKR